MQTSVAAELSGRRAARGPPGAVRVARTLLDESFSAMPSGPSRSAWNMDVVRRARQLSRALGAWLQSLGLEPGARVAIMLPNMPQFPSRCAAC